MLPDKVLQPTACYFCNITSLFGRQSRTKTGAQIVAELDGLYRIGWRGLVFFVDDNLIGNKQNLKQDLLPLTCEGKEIHPFFLIANRLLPKSAFLRNISVHSSSNSRICK